MTPPRQSPRLWLGTTLARGLQSASRRLGRGGGTTAPGRVLLRAAPDALPELGRRLSAGSALISATNGKTTTASMVATVMQQAGQAIVHNRAGSNMHWGVATALLRAGSAPNELGLFEVDEAWVREIARALRPKAFLFSNLFRDQLDRYGELETIAELWQGVVDDHCAAARFVLNADDPLVADLGHSRSGVCYFGVEDTGQALGELQHAADSKNCRRCGAAYSYEVAFLGHLGHYHCPNCGHRRPAPDVYAERVELRGMTGSRLVIATPRGTLELELTLPGLYNVYNALAACALSLELGASLEQIRAGLEGVATTFGRVETIPIAGRQVSILLVKNPTGTNEVLRTLTLERGELDLWIALNDNTADGRDISWIWDADFEVLAGRLRRVTCSGTRAEEMALRLKYAGIEAPISVERNLGASLDTAIASRNGGAPLYALPTYTALLQLRQLLADRGVAGRWSD